MGIAVTLPPLVNLSGNPINVKAQTDTVNVMNHTLHCIITLNGDYDIAEDRLPVINGAATFDISEYTKFAYNKYFFYPEINYQLLGKISSTLRVTVRFFEMYGTDGIKRNLTIIEDIIYVISGGLSKVLLDRFVGFGYNFYNKIIQNKKFLTWQQNNKQVGRNNIEKLYFFNLSSLTMILKVKIYLSNNTTQTITKLSRSVDTYCIYEVIASFKKLELSVYENSTVKITKYDVWLTDQSGNALSETRTFLLDESIKPNSKTIIFKNSLGGYDSLRFTHISEADFSFDFSLQNSPKLRKLSASGNQFRRLDSGSLGLIFPDPKKAAFYLAELFLSSDVYELDEYSAHKIIINSKKMSIYEDNKFIYNAIIEYYYDDIDNFYSPILEEADPSIDLENVFLITNEAEIPFFINSAPDDENIFEGFFYITND